jgi:hypothetical protein
MEIGWLNIAKGITRVAEQIFRGALKYQKVKTKNRKKTADLLDRIAKDVLSIAKELRKGRLPHESCAAVRVYSQELQPLIRRVYSKKVADRIGWELIVVCNNRQLARAIFDSRRRAVSVAADIKALTSTMEAAAGTIKASANIIHAL